MTENEAIKKIKYMPVKLFDEEADKAKRMAIEALEEIQQYRAIGTVEGYKRALEISKENFRVSMEYKAKVQEYETIGTIEEFKDLKEKSVAKKMLHNGANWYRCPNGCEIHKKQFEKDWYCPKCGQKMDFGKEE